MSDARDPQLQGTALAAGSELDRQLALFEQQWQRGTWEGIDRALDRVPEHVDRKSLLVELVHLELEFRLAAGEAARVEEYLDRYSSLADDQSRVLGLIRSEYEMRRRNERELSLEEYKQRFPWSADLLKRELARPARPRRGLAAMRLNCPHCQSPIEVSGEGHDCADVMCPSCGSSFKLTEDRTYSWKPEKLPRLGKFELLEAVGRGAFGTVYRARDLELDRIVAVKLPRSGSLTSPEDEDRFTREARSIAQLRHPNIVSIFETGRSDQFPYLVSEFVEGITLSDLLTGKNLGPRRAGELVATVADALEYAHQNGVIHRDVKPSNIMLDADDQPHLMDFGLARRDAGEVTMTMDGQVLGTPAYMSPEQARGEGHRVDGRSDVYSLGVILYELVTGELPFRGNTRMLLHQVLNDEPRALRSLNDRIPRDLETICLKAMAKEPARRYDRAADFSADLRRWLRHEPIVARPVGRLERSWRWVRRNSVVAGLSAALVLILLGGFVISTRFAIEANARAKDALDEKARADTERARAEDARVLEAKQRERAEEAERQANEDARRATLEAQKAQEVARFLARMFEEATPIHLVGLRFGSSHAEAAANMTAREILDRGAQRVTAELASQPILQASLKDTIGNVYLGLGMTDEAAVAIEEAYALRAEHAPRESLDMAASLQSVGTLRFAQMRFRQSAAALEEALAIRRKLLGGDHELVDATRESLATLIGLFKPRDWDQDAKQAQQLWRETLAWRRKHLGETHRDTAVAMFGLAGSLLNYTATDTERISASVRLMLTRGPEVASLLAKANPIILNDPGTKSLAVVMTEIQQAELKVMMGHPEQAVLHAETSLVSLREVIDDDHPLMFIGKALYARYLALASRFDEAEKLFRECLDAARRRNLALPPILFGALTDLTDPLVEQDPERAEAIYRETYTLAKNSLFRDRAAHPDGEADPEAYIRATSEFTYVLKQSGQHAEAENLYREALALIPRTFNGGFDSLRFTVFLGDTVRSQERFAEAEKVYRQSLEMTESCQFPSDEAPEYWRSRCLCDVARALKGQGKREESATYYRRVLALGDEDWVPRAEKELAAMEAEVSSR